MISIFKMIRLIIIKMKISKQIVMILTVKKLTIN